MFIKIGNIASSQHHTILIPSRPIFESLRKCGGLFLYNTSPFWSYEKKNNATAIYGNFTITDAEILDIEQSERGLLFSHVINLADIFPDQSGYAWALFYQPPDSLYFDVVDSETN